MRRRSQESGVRSQETETRGQRSEIRTPRSKVGGIKTGTGSYRLQRGKRRSQETEDRGQESGVRSQNRSWATILVFLILLALGTGASAADKPDYTREFVEASTAYDENRLPEAIQGWNRLLEEGQDLPAVLFNLGNAYYRNGDLGEAILAYRHAQTLAPRDPDIRANLGFAAQTAGITLPERNPLMGKLLEVSQSEWVRMTILCYWILFGLLGLWIVRPRFSFALRPLASGITLLLLIALAGLWAQHSLRATPEGVVMREGQKVLSSPLDSATPILAIPEGAIVRQMDQHGSWVEVEYEDTSGWLPASAITSVL